MERGRSTKVLGPKAGSASESGNSSRPSSAAGRRAPSEAGSSASGESLPASSGRGAGAGSSEDRRGGGRSEVSRKAKRRPSSDPAPAGVFGSLEKIKAVPAERQRELFLQKMTECKTLFDFSTSKDEGEKEGKRQTLLELVEYANSTPSCFDEKSLPVAFDMVGTNLFRALVKRDRVPNIMDPEDDSPLYDEGWPHLEVVYEFFLRIVSDKQVDATLAAKAMNRRFLVRLLDLFDSEDPREREQLKTALNKAYARFASLRTGIRRGIHNVCLRMVHEGGSCIGLSQLLEVLSRVIAGFSVPLKPEHRDLLYRALMPLHKQEQLSLFQLQLSDCLKKFVEKDAQFAHDITAGLLKMWPVTVAAKQLLFLGEVEELLGEVPQSQLPKLQDALAQRLAACVCCPNSDIAERALNLCKNGRVMKLVTQHCRTHYPVVISALYSNATAHWAGSVHKLTFEVLKLLMETDPELFDHSSARHRKEAGESEIRDAERERRWALLQQMHDRRRARLASRARGPPSANGELRGRSRTRTLGTPMVLGHKTELPLREGRYGVIGTWDARNHGVELGLQALLVDTRGKVVGAVHDRNNLAMQAAVWHTHTDSSAGKDLFDSSIWVRLSRLPQTVALLVIAVAAYSGGHLCDVPNGVIRVVEEAHDSDMAHFVLDPGAGDVRAIVCIKRGADGWRLMRMEASVKNRRHFVDILEPTLGRLIREMLPGLPRRHRAKLALTAMQQGEAGDLPLAVARWLFAGMGWDAAPGSSRSAEVTLSAVFFDSAGADLGVVHHGATELHGARLSSTGLLSGGVVFDLEALPQGCCQVVLLAHLLKEGTTFELVQRPYCCVVDPAGTELMRYVVAPGSGEAGAAGMALARLVRQDKRNRWAFQALGAPCNGRSWRHSLEELRPLVGRAPQELQVVPDEMKSASDSKRSIVSL